MKLLIVRHAIAEEKDDFAETGEPDSKRPLTKEGIKKMKRNAQGLRVLFPEIDTLISSPYTRASQTAEIISSAYGDLEVRFESFLEADQDPREMAKGLEEFEGRVCIVGHEPTLSQLTAILLSNNENPFFSFRKGGACLIDFSVRLEAGRGMLDCLWLPKQLRKIADLSTSD